MSSQTPLDATEIPCPHCNKLNATTNTQCRSCGKTLSTPETPESATEATNTTVGDMILGAALVFGAAYGIWRAFNSQTPEQSSAPSQPNKGERRTNVIAGKLNASYIQYRQEPTQTVEVTPQVGLPTWNIYTKSWDYGSPISVQPTVKTTYRTVPVDGYGFLPTGNFRHIVWSGDSVQLSEEGEYNLEATTIRLRWKDGRQASGTFDQAFRTLKLADGNVYGFLASG